MSVQAFEDLLSGPLEAFVVASKGIGGLVEKQAEHVADCFRKEGELLKVVATREKAGADEFQAMLAPVGEGLGKVGEVAAEAAPKDPLENHLTAMAESIGALGWVAVDSKPVSYVSDMEGAGEFYLLKVLMAYKKTEDFVKHEKFVESVRELYRSLKAFVKEYHTMALRWNTGLEAPAASAAGDEGEEDEEEGGSDPLSAFKALLAGPVKEYQAACKALGGAVEKQATSFVAAWTETEKLLEKAAKQAKPTVEEFQAMLTPLATEMGKVGETAGELPPKDPLENHITALTESVAALGWMAVESKPVSYIGDMEGAGEFYLSKVLMQYKKTDEFAKHEAFVKSVKAVYAGLKNYVKEYHTMAMSWNFAGAGKVRKVKKAAAAAADDVGGANALGAFQELVDGPLAAFVAASKELGGAVERQANSLAEGFRKENELLKTAAKQTKPTQEEFQAMLTPIATEMGAVAEVAADILPRDALFNHVTALSESVSVLGWVAVDSKPVSYISDCEGAGEFYLSKVLMQYKKTDEFAEHDAWVKALKALYAGLKAYVKEYHTMQLAWNFGAAKPKRVSRAAAGEDEGSGGADSLSAFRDLLSVQVKRYTEASKTLGGLVEKQAACFVAGMNEQLKLLEVAATKAKPSTEELQGMLGPLAEEMRKVGEVGGEAPPKDPLEHHLTAMSESVGALGWVAVDSKPVSYISDMEGAGEFYLSKALMQYKKTEEFAKHDEFVKSVKDMYAALKQYVKEHHTMALSWNFGVKTAVKKVAAAAEDDSGDGAGDPITGFEAVVTGKVADFVNASKEIGGLVEKQALAFKTAFDKELDLIKNAASMKKPGDEEIQKMVQPVGEEMGKVMAVTQEMPPKDPLENHLTALSEMVNALGWVMSDKSVSFISESAEAGNFYITRVLSTYRKTDAGKLHEAWVNAIKGTFDELKKYCKTHCPLGLRWNWKK